MPNDSLFLVDHPIKYNFTPALLLSKKSHLNEIAILNFKINERSSGKQTDQISLLRTRAPREKRI